MVNSRGGTFTPSQQTIVTGVSHSPHGSHHSAFSAGASPSTNSPTGSNSLTKIVVAQIYLLLSTIKEDKKDRSKWEQQAEQLRKLIDEHGMEVFQKYFSRMVAGNAPTIFSGINRPVANPGTYPILHSEVRKISHDVDQARRIAESIETANEDIFRDFDLSTFMDHFKLDALEKTILALAFKTGSRSDLKTKADAIISANYPQFIQFLVHPGPEHEDMPVEFLALMVDRFIQEHPPNFDEAAQRDLVMALQFRYQSQNQEKETIPTTVLAALYLIHALNNRNPLTAFLQRVGSAFTADEDSCRGYLRNGSISLNEEVVAGAIIYTALSRSIPFSTKNLVSSLRKEVSPNFNWARVIGHFDQDQLRISKDQFLALYEAFRQLAVDDLIDIQQLWGGTWQYSETQLSFISAYASLYDDELDATTIPGLQPAFTLEDFDGADEEIRQRAARAIKHPLVSVVALSSMFHVALHTTTASDTIEAKRLFQEVVVPNLDVFLVSAFGVPKPWPELATDTINNLFDRFLFKYDPNYDFVLEGLWRKDKQWVAQRLVEAHAKVPMELPTILEHALRHNWLDDLASIPNGFGLDLVAVASARGFLDLDRWAANNLARIPDLPHSLLTFLNIKAEHELSYQRQKHLHSVMLPVKTIAKLLQALEDAMPSVPSNELILVQRACITAYPRLINYGEGYDDVIDGNGAESNSLPKEANEKMEAHYKQMYSDEVEVRRIVEALERYKHSRDPADQDVFACMIHGLFDEYALYNTYPLEALATTAVLFGGIISHKLISELPLKIGLGMILEAVKDYAPQESMYKFGLQALMQLFSRLREWPGFCKRLLEVPGLQNTEAWAKAEDVIRAEQDARVFSPVNGINGGEMKTPPPPSFNALRVLPPVYQYPTPDEEITDKIQFILNNITPDTIDSKFPELQETVTEEAQHWFATDLVQERARVQPNYHNMYLNTIKLFGRKSLWADVLRETYVSTFKMLNAESTMQVANERTYLKYLATWLGSLTLARDKPIKHRNIAFKQLLIEGYESNRLLVVIPFVCKVLAQGRYSTVFKPPNPWVMDIIKALMELYTKADLKLNLRFEIEVLCGELELDHKSIEPSDEIMNRVLQIEETNEVMAPEILDRFDNLSMNGMTGGAGNGRFLPHEITASIPDLGPLLQYPPTNDMVNQGRLQDIVKTAITRAVHEIIAPVVERSVTIAAISTAQMIHKDFATEPNESRVRAAAINMVKKTAGALALVTSKEPLRASMTNYIRALSGEFPQGLPEGTIIMCVTSNLDLACSQVEKKAEERAVPEIEEMIEPELEARRHHKMTRPDDPYVDPGLSRWSWTIPDPFKLSPALGGLNQSQMAIYDEFARQPRVQPALPGPTHIQSSSDATRTMANDILQDSYPPVPNLPTPAEPPAMPHLPAQQPSYAQQNNTIVNGRVANMQMDPRMLAERVEKALLELERVAADALEQHFADLPRPHAVLDALDSLYGLIFRNSQGTDHYDYYIVDNICNMLFSGPEQDLVMECLVQVLENICRMAGRTANRVFDVISQRSGESFFRVPLIVCLTKAHLLEWGRIDLEVSRVISQRKDGSLQFFVSLLETVLLNDRPIALYADFAKSLETAWLWISEEPNLEVGQQLKQKLQTSGLPEPRPLATNDLKQDQLLYIFDEWVRLCSNPNASDNAPAQFISQMYNRQQINNRDDLHMFLRLAIDSSVDRFEQLFQNDSPANEAYMATDSLAKLIALLVKGHEQDGAVKTDKAAYLNSILSLTILVLNHHHVLRGESFNQKPFYRLYCTILFELDALEGVLSEEERQEVTLVFARIFLRIPPTHFPGFMTSWMSLISHRNFMPLVLGLPREIGWGLFADIMEKLLFYLGELLKPVINLDPTTSQIYRAVVKLVIILHHDFPEFLSANHSKLCVHVPSYSTQLNNLILSATPPQYVNMPNPMQPGIKLDRVGEIRQSPESMHDLEGPLRESGLFDLAEQALEHGPSEDAVAHIAHQIQRKQVRQTGLGLLPVDADRKLIDSLVLYVGANAIARSENKGAPIFTSGTPDIKLLSMLVHELRPATRFVFLGSIVNQLRFPNTHTHYFNQALLELFGSDSNDQEDLEIREQITRILLERSIGQWPQPWGLLVVIQELVKNKKYMFFDLPFIKSAPEVGERFLALVQAGPVQ
ncbi:related to CDC39 protein [Rhynchosporium agropyri]|uniref:General negative regulator of transcription subunit 1 n=1 Tax=Rhynchosporium agropyri TaxID=914238 RepID=A0A1E1L3F8_9HELO|nr:related to CDC39 protein [Rhynchosporium agropyri]